MAISQHCPFTKSLHISKIWLKNKSSEASQIEPQHSVYRLSFSTTLCNQFPFTDDIERGHELYKRKITERSRRGRTDSSRSGKKMVCHSKHECFVKEGTDLSGNSYVQNFKFKISFSKRTCPHLFMFGKTFQAQA